MRYAFLLALAENGKFGFRLLRAIPCARVGYTLIRLIFFPIIWLAIAALSLVHFAFFLLDEILFAAYRHVQIKEPVFILGVPRSGTTWLQRVMANDKNMTTLTLAEAIFAPSITQRYILKALSFVFAPLTRLFSRLPIQWLKRMDAIHKIRFSEPEEDFLLFIPLHACFLLMVLCPKSKHYWNLGKFDHAVPNAKKKIIMHFYALCVKKHLYFHGKQHTFLSKNPSFTPFIEALKEEFPDAHIIACTRAPNETVPSQLNSLKPTQELIGIGMPETEFNHGMMNTLLHYYKIIQDHAEHVNIVNMPDLNAHLDDTVKKLYSNMGKLYDGEFAHIIASLAEKGRNYKSEHHYDLSRYALTEDDIQQRFSPYWPTQHTKPNAA